MPPRAAAVLFTLGAVWGASFLFIEVVVDEVTPLQLVTGRHIFGLLVLAPLLPGVRRRLNLRQNAIHMLFLAAFASSLPFWLISWAQEHIDSGITSVLNSTMPIFTAIFAVALLEEDRLSAGVLAGLALGLGGAVVLSADELTNVSADGLVGHLAVIAAAAFYGASNVYARMFLQAEDRVAVSVGQLAAAALFLVPLAFAVDGVPDLSLSTKAWLAWAALGGLGTGVGVVAYYWLIREIGSVPSSIVTYIIPVVGLILGAAVLNEDIGPNAIIGAALIIVGVAAVMGVVPLARRAPAPAVAGDGEPVEPRAAGGS